jgi:hypothetical protein
MAGHRGAGSLVLLARALRLMGLSRSPITGAPLDVGSSPPAPQRAVHARLNARALAKAKSLPADALIFDLEDAVADAKASA